MREFAFDVACSDLQTVRDWVIRFNAEGPDGLRDRKAPGPTPRLTDVHRQALAAQIDHGPIPAVRYFDPDNLHDALRAVRPELDSWLRTDGERLGVSH